MAFHLRQVEEGAGAARDLFFGVVEQEDGEVKNAAAHALAINQSRRFGTECATYSGFKS